MKSRLTLWLIVAVCIAPVLLSYMFYYGIRPDERTNYGELIQPQLDLTALPVNPLVKPQAESGFLDVLRATDSSEPRAILDRLEDFRGRWLIIRVGPSECGEDCKKALWVMRQVRLTTGRDRDRVERLWLVIDNSVPDQAALTDYEGTWVLGVTQEALQSAWNSNPLGAETSFWLVDPLGNLMMRFPQDPDPAKMKKDLIRLLKASRIG
ncbi:MAG: cytochrome C oxidase subunit I [Bordetella sp.]